MFLPTYDDLIRGWPLRETRAATGEIAPGAGSRGTLPEEMRSNALAAYAVDPAQFKRLAPGVAKAIRDQWNAHPILSRAIQFNALAGLGLGLPLSVLLGLDELGGSDGQSADDGA